MKPENLEKIRQMTEKFVKHIATIEERIKNSPVNPIVGNVYCLPSEYGIEWAIVRNHPDDPNLWFVVPQDMYPQVGTWDVQLAEEPYVLRCGAGIWANTEQLPYDKLSGFLTESDLMNARQKLAAMVGSKVKIEPRENVEADPDYQEWMQIVLSAANCFDIN